MQVLLLVVCVVYVVSTGIAGSANLVIVILSQSNPYHEKLANELKSDIVAQSGTTQRESPVVYLSHVDFPHVGAWAVTPLIPHLAERHRENCLWFVFVEDRTRIKLDELNKTLEKYDCNQEVWLGHAIHDIEPTIIHHFRFYNNPTEFKYPNSVSGFAITSMLMKKLTNRLQTDIINSDFAIDYAYELALFIWNDGKGPNLLHESSFCVTENKKCCTLPQLFVSCGSLVPKNSIYFAVKTCGRFHENRIPVVQQTWGLETHYLNFFSDVKDDSIPTVSLDIPNTERGHCTKTFKIIKHVAKYIKKLSDIKWITIADDDTILSVLRLRKLLTCYDYNMPVALGERYGYNIHKMQGYNYITGGGGIVLSRILLDKLAKTQACECPSLSSPDDMFLGVCLARLGIDITHSSLFHQARPVDYAPEYLQHQHIVSFHKHWMIDPINVYNQWFTNTEKHIEL